MYIFIQLITFHNIIEFYKTYTQHFVLILFSYLNMHALQILQILQTEQIHLHNQFGKNTIKTILIRYKSEHKYVPKLKAFGMKIQSQNFIYFYNT